MKRKSAVAPLLFLSAAALAQSSGLKPAREGELFGYKDAKGEWAIKPQFVLAFEFDPNGLAPVRIRTEECVASYSCAGYIDATGKWAIQERFSMADGFAENGLAAAQPGRGIWKYGYIDAKGKWVIPPRFAIAYGFAANGLASVKPDLDGKSGYIDATGKIVIKPRFDFAGGFGAASTPPNRAPVKLGEDWRCIDEKGEVVGVYREPKERNGGPTCLEPLPANEARP